MDIHQAWPEAIQNEIITKTDANLREIKAEIRANNEKF
jgi:hypothetical protein